MPSRGRFWVVLPHPRTSACAWWTPLIHIKEVFAFSRSFLREGDFFEDLACGLCPDEEFGIGIVVLQVLHDGALEFGDAVEGAAANAVSGDLGEEALNHVEPGRRGRGEVQVEARMRLEPALYGRRLMGG